MLHALVIVLWLWNLWPVSFRAMASVFGIGCTVVSSDLGNAPPTRSLVSSWRFVVILNAQKSMNTKTPACWASDPQSRGLRIELSAEHSLLLPYDQFVFSELKNNGKEQQLRLVFATHEIFIRGHALRRIETAMQRMELSFLAKLEGKQQSLAPDGQPVVLELAVTEIKGAESEPGGG
jgi:hypothetical protein